MKKLMLIAMTAVILASSSVDPRYNRCKHVHNEECGYVEETQEGCTHVHTAQCRTLLKGCQLGAGDHCEEPY